MKRTLVAVTAVVVLWSAGMVHAGDIVSRNRADPVSNAKINRFVAEAYRQTDNSNFNINKGIQVDQSCGAQNLGNVTVGPGQKTPDEVITVIKGTVVNVCKQ